MKKIAERILKITPSATLAITMRAKAMKREGKDVISFGAGEPDFPTPDYIKIAAEEAINSNQTGYTPQAGIPELREAVAKRVSGRTGRNYGPEEIAICAGAKQAIAIALQALVEPGDEVILPTPCWVSYPDMIQVTGAAAVTVDCEATDDFMLDAAKTEKLITPKTKAVILNFPSNPTGAIMPPSRLAEIAELAKKHDLWVIADEIYEDLVYGDAEYQSFIAAAPDAAERTIHVSGVSKTYAMTGWRIGWAAGPKEVISGMANYQGHEMGNPCSVSQYAALAAITGPQDEVAHMVASFDERRMLMHSRLSSMPDIVCPEPKGAFYCFPDVSAYYPRKFNGEEVGSSHRFCEIALDKFGIALIPGEAFFAPKHVRLSYATSEDLISKGLDRFEEFLKSIK
ncbi:MAG: pyridoxal phosphate-dependent aminotransferase [Planctomycetota bacterium]|jgi:aspartate aminotransferase